MRVISWFWGVIIIGIFLVSSSLFYSNYLVSRLAIEEEHRVTLLAKAQEFIGNTTDTNCELNFILENILKGNESVPVIFADKDDHILEHRNIIDTSWSEEQQKAELAERLAEMKASDVPPVMIQLLGIPESAPVQLFLFYDESDLLKQLRWFPYGVLLVMGVFILFVFAGYALTKRSEQNKLWAGLARETAHQLGTPITGMVAWMELLKMESLTPQDREEYFLELNKDIARLQQIADRFSRIGSKPDLHLESPSVIIERSVNYMSRRVSQRASLQFQDQLPQTCRVNLDSLLMEWVIENLLRNAVDALPDTGGKVMVRTFYGKQEEVIIEVEDTGKGITRAQASRIFRTGFTTKKRGWGLGLSLSKRIIENFFGGKINLYKSELGKGSVFRIILPENRNFEP